MPPQAEPAADYDHEAWYLVPEMDPEPEVAKHYWQPTLGKNVDPNNILTELPISLLHSRSSVYVLARKPKRGKFHGIIRPHLPIVDSVDGANIHKAVDFEELAKDMEAYGPIRIADSNP